MFNGDNTGQNKSAYHNATHATSNDVSNDVFRCVSNDAASESEVKISVPEKPAIYQIRICGHLDGKWAGYFEEFSIDLDECGNTVLTGPVIDQAMLHGLFKKIRDLGLVLISVNVSDKQ